MLSSRSIAVTVTCAIRPCTSHLSVDVMGALCDRSKPLDGSMPRGRCREVEERRPFLLDEKSEAAIVLEYSHRHSNLPIRRRVMNVAGRSVVIALVGTLLSVACGS